MDLLTAGAIGLLAGGFGAAATVAIAARTRVFQPTIESGPGWSTVNHPEVTTLNQTTHVPNDGADHTILSLLIGTGTWLILTDVLVGSNTYGGAFADPGGLRCKLEAFGRNSRAEVSDSFQFITLKPSNDGLPDGPLPVRGSLGMQLVVGVAFETIQVKLICSVYPGEETNANVMAGTVLTALPLSGGIPQA